MRSIQIYLFKRNFTIFKECVIAVSSFNYLEFILSFLNVQAIIPIDLQDQPEHVFERFVFTDENDVIYRIDEYKNKYKDHQLTELISDCYYYYKIFHQSILLITNLLKKLQMN